MIRLDEKDYGIASKALRQVPINTLFAQAVIAGQVEGEVYTDNPSSPSAFYIRHTYAMSLLFGNTEDALFHRKLREYLVDAGHVRGAAEWLQVFPDDWNGLLRELVTTTEKEPRLITENTRVNFVFDRNKFEASTRGLSLDWHRIVPMTKEHFAKLDGRVTPKHFWKNVEQFLAEGMGYCLIENGEPVSIAFSAYRIGNQLEIGVETAESARGKGYARLAGIAMISYCLEQGLEPVWACRKENGASFSLAQKLGFVPTVQIPYYRLETS